VSERYVLTFSVRAFAKFLAGDIYREVQGLKVSSLQVLSQCVIRRVHEGSLYIEFLGSRRLFVPSDWLYRLTIALVK
jgi:hypothetical protein